MRSLIQLGVNGGSMPTVDYAAGTHPPADGLFPGLSENYKAAIQGMSVPELYDLMQLNSLSIMMVNNLTPAMAVLAYRTGNGLYFFAEAREGSHTPEDTAKFQQAGVSLSVIVENLVPKIREAIPATFMQMDYLAYVLANRSNQKIVFYAPVYYKDENRMSANPTTRMPDKAFGAVGTVDFTKSADVSLENNTRNAMVLFKKMLPTLRKIEPKIDEVFAKTNVSLGVVEPISWTVVIMGFLVISAVALVVAALIYISILTLLAYLTKNVEHIMPALATALKEFNEHTIGPLAIGIQWLLIMTAVGLAAGLVLGAPEFVDKMSQKVLGFKAGFNQKATKGNVPPPIAAATGGVAVAVPTRY